MVSTVVTVLELEGLPSKGLPHDLVPHADTESGLLAQQLPGVLNSVGGGGGVPLRKHTRVPADVNPLLRTAV